MDEGLSGETIFYDIQREQERSYPILTFVTILLLAAIFLNVQVLRLNYSNSGTESFPLRAVLWGLLRMQGQVRARMFTESRLRVPLLKCYIVQNHVYKCGCAEDNQMFILCNY